MRPSSRPKRAIVVDKFSEHRSNRISLADIKLKKGGCPSGMVPIRRMNNNDLLVTQLPHQYYHTLGASSNKNNSASNTYFALGQPKSNDHANLYHGVGATLSVYRPPVKASQYSSGEIILRDGSDEITVGWTVNPDVYRDNQARFFIYTIARDQHCFNSQCGFISVRQDVALGFVISPVSTFRKAAYVLDFFVYQDANDGNWWLEMFNGTSIGFWPRNFFGGLHDSASYFACGGEVSSPSDLGQPDMGSGYKPFSLHTFDSAYCIKIVKVDETHKVVSATHLDTYSNDRNYVPKFEPIANILYYGGPKNFKY